VVCLPIGGLSRSNPVRSPGVIKASALFTFDDHISKVSAINRNNEGPIHSGRNTESARQRL